MHTLVYLKELNLQCNQLKQIAGLSNLFQLEKLILSHNKIASLSGLQQISGKNYKLRLLDLRNNKVDKLKELDFLG